MFAEIHTEPAIQEIKTPALPTKYSNEIAESICYRVAEGETLTKICGEDDMPNVSTVYSWLSQPKKYEFFDKGYACARATQIEVGLDQILDIADNTEGDMYFDHKSQTMKVDHDTVQRARLMIDARKWRAEKMAPTKYGVNVQVEVKGTVKHVHEIIMSPDMLGVIGRVGISEKVVEGECEDVSDE